MDNETYFQDLQTRFPNLSSVNYQNGQLIFPQGILALNKFLLSSILPSTFALQTKNIYLYLGYQYYKMKEMEIKQVLALFNQKELSNEDQEFLKFFATDYARRVSMYNEEAPILNQDSVFMLELTQREKVIGESFQRTSEWARIISSTYTEKINQSINDNTTNNNENKQSLGHNFSLTRSKNNLPPILPNDDTNLGIAGFTTIFIIIFTTVIAGVYIAWKMMG